ncbi:MAG: hypothetical protein J1E80_09720 [Desulfovibrionaceae bacterium]|nr:hypothetical protein [Desulfovibrionaceae bacterium]
MLNSLQMEWGEFSKRQAPGQETPAAETFAPSGMDIFYLPELTGKFPLEIPEKKHIATQFISNIIIH